MLVFLDLAAKILPLYFMLVLGYLAGRFLGVTRENVANLVIYIIAPVVFAGTIAGSDIQLRYLALPLLTFSLAVVIAAITWVLTSLWWKDSTRNLLSAGLGVGNTGYFGLPVALALFDPATAGLYVLANFGDALFLSTAGYYITARGRFSARESLRRTLRLPILYAVPCGVIFSLTDWTLPETAQTLLASFKGAYSVLGMMIIGIALASFKKLEIDLRLIALSNAIRFLLWPALVLGLVFADRHFLHIFDEPIHRIYLLISVMPAAANMVILSSSLNIHPEKAAAVVLSSTLLALVIIPLAQIFLF